MRVVFTIQHPLSHHYISEALITQACTSWMSPAWHTHITSAAVCTFFIAVRLFFSVQPHSEAPVPLKAFHGIIRQKYVIKFKSC